MYEACKQANGERLTSLGSTAACAVRHFITDYAMLPAVVYGPDGPVVARIIEGELPAEPTLEPAAAPESESAR